MGYPYSDRREHYRRDPWYVMVKKGKGSIYTVLFLVDEKFVGGNIRAVRDFPDVFP
jgi:hypothetical protein